jgi:hypothetical protein
MARSKHKKQRQEEVSGAEFVERMKQQGSRLKGLKAVFPWKIRRHTAKP